ncbi:dTMP kinase [Corynebacterium tapiri]|uniref:Thymidylate kinase n=1 Tax=Corynebacterium tapiri TaxID=1448266 RepID=A0A5C4U420_9CORY|nr:dTMP kinase [Corynebacterium tapiri]TNL98419.1 dTMP kinase [Corynebacterium tapiri]
MILAVEGVDGAGKNTLVTALSQQLGAERVSFPRYSESLPAHLAQEALHGRMGDLTDSAYAMATLFALDRAGAREQLLSYAGSPDKVIILDRYVASNAAYSWARTGDEGIVEWVADLEFSQMGLPKPDLHVLLATAPEEARRRAQRREATDNRQRDRYEKDAGLQDRTFAAYQTLARRNWMSQWVETSNPDEVAARLAEIR